MSSCTATFSSLVDNCPVMLGRKGSSRPAVSQSTLEIHGVTQQGAAKDLDKAADKVDDKLVAFNNAAAKDAYNLAVAKADGDRKVALANCLSISGDAQKNCKDQAEADYAAAKANAKAAAQSVKE